MGNLSLFKALIRVWKGDRKPRYNHQRVTAEYPALNCSPLYSGLEYRHETLRNPDLVLSGVGTVSRGEGKDAA